MEAVGTAGGASAGALCSSHRWIRGTFTILGVFRGLIVTRHFGVEKMAAYRVAVAALPSQPLIIARQETMSRQQGMTDKREAMERLSERETTMRAHGGEAAGAPTHRTLISATADVGSSDCARKASARNSHIRLWCRRSMVASILPRFSQSYTKHKFEKFPAPCRCSVLSTGIKRLGGCRRASRLLGQQLLDQRAQFRALAGVETLLRPANDAPLVNQVLGGDAVSMIEAARLAVSLR